MENSWIKFQRVELMIMLISTALWGFSLPSRIQDTRMVSNTNTSQIQGLSIGSFGLLRPKPQGNIESESRVICFFECVGIYGCLTHQNSISRDKRSEIVFKNKVEAFDFFEKNLEKALTLVTTSKKLLYKNYWCRRSQLQKHCGHHPCKSQFSISPTFNNLKKKYEEHAFN